MFHKLFVSIMNLWFNELISDEECARLIVVLDMKMNMNMNSYKEGDENA